MGANLVYLNKPKKQKETLVGKYLGNKQQAAYSYVCSSMQGWRLNMEDAHIANPNLTEDVGLFAVFDGHGGVECAKYCEKFFEQKIKEDQNFKSRKDLGIALENTYMGLDQMLTTQWGMEQMIQISKEHPHQLSPVEKALKQRGMKSRLEQYKQEQYSYESMEEKGCTANSLLIYNNFLICANAGDSRCVVGEAGKAVPLSKDHKPMLKKERARIIKAGSMVNREGRIDGNLNLSRAIGDMCHKKNIKLPLHEQAITALPDIKMYEINPHTDFVVMGCDGIFEIKKNQQIVDFIYMQMNKKIKIEKIAENLLDTLLSPNVNRTNGIGCDNMSLIIIDFREGIQQMLLQQQQQRMQQQQVASPAKEQQYGGN